MYEKIKSYINRYSWVWYLLVAGIACAICWLIYGRGNDSDYNRTTDHMERVKGEQQKSIELNQTVEDSVERVSRLNQQASERITRIEVYPQQLFISQNDLMKQNAYLNEMNNSLNELSKDIKRNHQTEQRLHRQRNTWALISGLLIVGLVIK